MKSKLFFIQLIVSVFVCSPSLGNAINYSIEYKSYKSIQQLANYTIYSSSLPNPSSDFVAQFLPAPLSQNLPSKETFTKKSLKLISKIRSCLLCITILAFGILPKFYQIADMSDSPGILLIAFVLLFIPFLSTSFQAF